MEQKDRQNVKRIIGIGFVIYLALLFYFLFFSERYGRIDTSEEYRYNLVLFQEIKRFITYRHILGVETFVVNILGNVLAFVPFGMMVPMLGRKNKKFIEVSLLCFELSLSIELIQLVTKVGAYDVDDLLLNTLGGMIGYMLYYIIAKLRKRSVRINAVS